MRHSLLAITLLLCSRLGADTLSFEDLPNVNFFSDAWVNIGSLYSGVTFGPGVTGLSVTRFGGYSDTGYPTHSGDVVVWSPFDFDTTISFTTPEAFVGLWYTSFDSLTLTAYDAGNAMLGSATGNPNTDGFSGVSSFLSVTTPGITSVVLSGSPGFFVFDDVTYQEDVVAPVPEPSSLVLAVTFAAFLGIARRYRPRS